jgi:hypothetical protein
MMRLDQALTIDDLQKMARARVPRMFYDYADSGSWTESTYRANSEDLRAIRFEQRVAVNLADRTLESDMAGSDRGADRAAVMYTLIATAKLNDVDPQAWLAEVLARIADTPQGRLSDLLPWNWRRWFPRDANSPILQALGGGQQLGIDSRRAN